MADKEETILENGLGPQRSQNGEAIRTTAGQKPKSNGEPPKCWQSDRPYSKEPPFGDT